ncbi:MAG: hypothetical protein Q4D94_07430 [Bacillota bacterium]|nr:hypothetical protein [Bacillota bacterium]
MAVWYMKSDVRKLFSLKLPSVKSALGGGLLCGGAGVLILGKGKQVNVSEQDSSVFN